ncbi:MAG: hypothetical protein WBK70_00110 [Thermacetogeniaceae bacterium]
MSKITGISVKVRLIMVAILTSGTKGIGRKNHSTTFLRVIKEVVPVITAQTRMIMVNRPAKRKPVISPFVEMLVTGKYGIGSPGILKASTTITIKIIIPKNLISFNKALIGSFAISKAKITTNNSTR